MSDRVNIRTVNGQKLNPLLSPKFQRIQNRAAAVWDAYDEYGCGHSLEMVAHLHRISVEQIHYDMYGNPSDIDKRFGIDDSRKLERTLHVCLKEIKEGIDESLVAVANHVPFCLIHELEDARDIKLVANDFLRNMSSKLSEIRQKHRHEVFESVDCMVTTYNSLIYSIILHHFRLLQQQQLLLHHLFDQLRTIYLLINRLFENIIVRFEYFHFLNVFVTL
jgi:hypothetical protein